MLEASPTLPGRSHTQLTLTMRFQMLHFQIPHLLRYMKTAHRIPRHETSSMHKFPFPFYLSSPFMATFRRAEYLYISIPCAHVWIHPCFFLSWLIALTQMTWLAFNSSISSWTGLTRWFRLRNFEWSSIIKLFYFKPLMFCSFGSGSIVQLIRPLRSLAFGSYFCTCCRVCS